MRVRGTIALAVVAGGITLGAVLGAAANPKMKQPAEEAWLRALESPASPGPGALFVDSIPQDPTPYRDSYAPSWAHEELASWEPDYPAWSYSDFGDDDLADLGVADAPVADEQPEADEQQRGAADTPVETDDLTPEPQVAGHLAALY